MQDVIGIDFGTTNSVIARRMPDGQTVGLRYAAGQGMVETFRSVLCFWAEESGASRGRLQHAAGPDAIEAYLDDPLGARLIMSMKSYLASRSFQETRVFNRAFTLEDLISTFLRALVAGAAGMPAGGGTRVVAGRPVRFVGDNADDTLAETRLRAAFGAAGFAPVEMALEPEAAGHRFASTLDGAANVLVGDFGGGTSDFSILRFEPGARWTMPAAAGLETVRTLYVFAGDGLRLDGQEVAGETGALVHAGRDIELEGVGHAEVLLLQGRPIGESQARSGPFVMNTEDEIEQAFEDYRTTRFGGWSWPQSDPVHGDDPARFAIRPDGTREEPAPVAWTDRSPG